MITTVADEGDVVSTWVAEQLDVDAEFYRGQPAVGVLEDGKLLAGVVASKYWKYPKGQVLEAAIAAKDTHWCNRRILRSLFAYPFEQLRVTRLQVVCREDNAHGRQFVERLGFKFEGILRRSWEGVADAALYSMLPDECRWVEGARQ